VWGEKGSNKQREAQGERTLRELSIMNKALQGALLHNIIFIFIFIFIQSCPPSPLLLGIDVAPVPWALLSSFVYFTNMTNWQCPSQKPFMFLNLLFLVLSSYSS